jgi:hypothetical protein
MALRKERQNNQHARVESVYRGGAIAQLGERLVCNQKVVGSIPTGSTNS